MMVINNMNKTKLIATISPLRYDEKELERLINSGIDVVRLNTNYADAEFCTKVVNAVNKLNEKYEKNVATLMDLEGPCIRVREFYGGEARFKTGDKIRMYFDDSIGDMTRFSINYPDLLKYIKYKTTINLSNGLVKLQIVEKGLDYAVCEVLKGGPVRNNSRIYFPDVKIGKNYLSEKDREDIILADKLNVDFIIASFVSTSEDILDVSDVLMELGNDHIGILAKIELKDAIEDIDNIIRVADGVVLSREDLRAEIPLEDIPNIQRTIISKCIENGKLGIITAEVHQFSSDDLRPTRAEVTDIAGSIDEGIDAIILAGEIAISKYPVETILEIQKVITKAEEHLDYDYFFSKALTTDVKNITGTVSSSVVLAARELKCKAIVATTHSGYTARRMSKLRPTCPIIAPTISKDVIKSLALHFGVCAVLTEEIEDFSKNLDNARKVAEQTLNLKPGDKIIITGGYPFKNIRHTNFMKIDEI